MAVGFSFGLLSFFFSRKFSVFPLRFSEWIIDKVEVFTLHASQNDALTRQEAVLHSWNGFESDINRHVSLR